MLMLYMKFQDPSSSDSWPYANRRQTDKRTGRNQYALFNFSEVGGIKKKITAKKAASCTFNLHSHLQSFSTSESLRFSSINKHNVQQSLWVLTETLKIVKILRSLKFSVKSTLNWNPRQKVGVHLFYSKFELRITIRLPRCTCWLEYWDHVTYNNEISEEHEHMHFLQWCLHLFSALLYDKSTLF